MNREELINAICSWTGLERELIEYSEGDTHMVNGLAEMASDYRAAGMRELARMIKGNIQEQTGTYSAGHLHHEVDAALARLLEDKPNAQG